MGIEQEIFCPLVLLASSNLRLVLRWFRCKLARLALPPSGLLRSGCLSGQRLKLRRRRHLYACGDVCGGVYVCDGFQVEQEILVDPRSIHLLVIYLGSHCILGGFCMEPPHLVGVLALGSSCRVAFVF